MGTGTGTLLSGGRLLLLVWRGSQGIDDHKHHDFDCEQGHNNRLAHVRFTDIHRSTFGRLEMARSAGSLRRRESARAVSFQRRQRND